MADATMAAALRLLGRRDHSSAELKAKLLAKGHAGADVDRVVVRLTELRYLDDERLAERLATAFSTSGRGVGRRLVLELRKRGIAADLADAAVVATKNETDEVALARGLVARRYPAVGPAADQRERQRVMNFLQRRGFALATIWQVLTSVHSETPDESLVVSEAETRDF
jgi:regulatory protein